MSITNRNTISLKWESKIVEWKNKCENIVYQKIKMPDEDLTNFIKVEKEKGAIIYLDFNISGIDLGFWINTNFYRRKTIGLELRNSLSFNLNNEKLNNVALLYLKIHLKRFLGQLVNIEDYIGLYDIKMNDFSPAFFEARGLMKRENVDTMLYCSGCCGDRDCGHLGMQVYHSGNEIIWLINIGLLDIKYTFGKSDYFQAFKEYIDLINSSLKKNNFEVVDVEDEGHKFINIENQSNKVCSKYQIDRGNFDVKRMLEIFTKGCLDEIIILTKLAKKYGLDMDQANNQLNAIYDNLTEKEKEIIWYKRFRKGEYPGYMIYGEYTLISTAYYLYC